MLAVYNAISFIKEFTRGGRTKPWLIEAVSESGNISEHFIVKLFNPDELSSNCSVLKEVLGSVLAEEFDLHSPAPALIKFSEKFENTIPEKLKK